jgi:hypothetical protein
MMDIFSTTLRGMLRAPAWGLPLIALIRITLTSSLVWIAGYATWLVLTVGLGTLLLTWTIRRITTSLGPFALPTRLSRPRSWKLTGIIALVVPLGAAIGIILVYSEGSLLMFPFFTLTIILEVLAGASLAWWAASRLTNL